VVLLLFLSILPRPLVQIAPLPSFRAIVSDVQPSVIMTTTALAARVDDLLKLTPELRSTRVLVTNTLPTDVAESWQRPNCERRYTGLFPVHVRLDRTPEGGHGDAWQSIA